MVHCAIANAPYEWSPSVERATDPNKKRRWLVIPILLAQIALKKFVIDRLLEDDGAVGDQYGPFEPETIAENREVLQRRKVGAPEYTFQGCAACALLLHGPGSFSGSCRGTAAPGDLKVLDSIMCQELEHL